jgi:hypothetical protein
MSSLRQIIAESSLEWRDTDKVSFIWGSKLVIAYVNRDYKRWYVLTDLAPEDEQDVNKWFGSFVKALEESEEDE